MSDRSRSRSRKQSKKSRARLRAWAVVNLAVLLAFSGWVYHNANATQTQADLANRPIAIVSNVPKPQIASSAPPTGSTAKAAAPQIPTKAQILALTSGPNAAKYFGVSAANVPYAPSALQGLAAEARVSPDMVEYYVNWTQQYNPNVVREAYAQGTIPVLTWESFAGLQGSTWNTLNQSTYSLSTIIDGDHDAYITSFAKAVATARLPVVIRLDHEMNGNWFPWSEGRNGNSTGQYVEAWRHIWTLFQQAGATNVIWDWAPNVIRGATISDLQELYPGDQYVDWIGLSAYQDTETTPQELISPSLDEIREFTQRPMLITETGARLGAAKPVYTTNFLAWLPSQPGIIGFIWNEMPPSDDTGDRTGDDWGFDTDPNSLAAFQNGIKNLTLVKVPPV